MYQIKSMQNNEGDTLKSISPVIEDVIKQFTQSLNIIVSLNRKSKNANNNKS